MAMRTPSPTRQWTVVRNMKPCINIRLLPHRRIYLRHRWHSSRWNFRRSQDFARELFSSVRLCHCSAPYSRIWHTLTKTHIQNMSRTKDSETFVRDIYASLIPVMARARYLQRFCLYCGIEAFLYNGPVEIREEGVNVVFLLGGHIVHHIRVLPEIECE